MVPIHQRWLLLLAFGALAPGAAFAGQVDVLRDPWGVPHIFAASEDDGCFGLGYACAEDRMLQMDLLRRLGAGRLAEVFGPDWVDSDRQARIAGHAEWAPRALANLPGEMRSQVRAYAAGVNAWMAANPEALARRFAPTGHAPEPWTPGDCLLAARGLLGIGAPFSDGPIVAYHGFHELCAQVGEEEARRQSAMPVDDSAAIVSEAEMAEDGEAYARLTARPRTAGLRGLGVGEGPKMSHAWAVGGTRSTTGAPILESDPQLPLSSPPFFHELHLSAGRIEARGLGLPGCPGLFIGYNRRVAWGASALGTDSTAVFLDRLGRRPGSYVYQDAPAAFDRRLEVIHVKGAQDVVQEVLTNRHGTVFNSLAREPRAGEAYVLYDAQTVTGGTSVEALLAFMSAGTWEEFRAAMERYYDPGLHVVFADAEGNLAYQTLVHRPLTTAPARLAQEGWTGAQDITGRIPLDEMPHKLNPKSGFISHANNMPVGSWYPHDLGIATGGTGHTARSWRLEQLLSGDRRFSPDDFESVLHRDDVNSVVAALLPVARKVVEEDGVAEPEVLALVQAVAEWDLRAGSVARFPVAAGLQNTLTPYRGAGLNKRYGAGAGGVANLARRLAAEFAVTGEGPQDPAIRAYLLSWLRASARATSGETPVPDATITIPYQRCLPHNLPAVAPEKDIVSPPLSCLDTGTVWSQPGNVYTQIVDLADPDNSRAALAPGNSEDLGSPHRTSGMELWVKGRTRPAPLSRAAVEALGCTRTALTTQGHAGPDAAPPLTVAAADPAARYVPAIPAVEPPSEAAQPGLVRGRKPDDPRLEAAFRVILRQGTAQADVDAQLARCREFVAAEPALVGQLRDAATLGVYLIEESAAGRLAVQYGSPHVLGKLQELLAELGDGDEATGARPPDDPDLARPERGVFAHYMVCNPRAGGDAGVEDYMAEIRDAQAAGIDGFALNCGGWTRREPHYKQRTALIYEAARRLDTGFLLFISADYAGDLTLEETRDMVASFRDHPNQFRHDGKPVLSTFSGEGADNNAGRELIAFLGREFPDGEGARGVCFVPYYMPRPSITELPDKSHADQVFDTFPGLDGFFYFGAAGTGDALAASNALLADKWVGAGRVYMASVTPYYRGLGGNYRCFETRGFESMAAEFVAAIEHKASWIEIVTWNDWGEASYVCPFGAPGDTMLWNDHWGAMLSHEGYLRASRYYINWYKRGAPPPIEHDELYYFHRLHPAALEGQVKPGEQALGRPSGANALRDSVFVTCYLKAPAILTVYSGDRQKTFELPAGAQHVEVPFALGAQRFVLARNGATVVDKTSEHKITDDTSSNFNVFAGCATTSLVPEPGSRATEPAPGRRSRILRDVVYGTTHPEDQRLDAYLPRAGRPAPVVLELHGGGWRRGAKSEFTYPGGLIEGLLDAGFALVSVEYRLAPEHPLPAAMEDVARAVQFVRSQATEWNLDPERVAFLGGSAGAHLGAWVALHDDLADPASDDPVARLSTRVSAFVDLWGPMDLTRARPSQLLGSGARGADFAAAFTGAFGCTAEEYEGDPAVGERIRAASPLFLVTPDDPPGMIVHRHDSDLTPERHLPAPETINDPHSAWHGVLLAEALTEVGVPVECRIGPQVAADASAATAAIVQFLQTRTGEARARGAGSRTAGPEVWLCAGAPVFDLLQEGADWGFVRERLTGLKLYVGQLANTPPARLAELARLVSDLDLQVAVEIGCCLDFGPMDETNGEWSAASELAAIENWYAAGGKVDFLDLDGPIRRLLFPDNRADGQCFTSMEAAAEEVVDAVSAIHAAHPEIRFWHLTNFPNWGYKGDVSYHARGADRQDYGEYDDAHRLVFEKLRDAGVPLEGVTIDNPYDYLIGEHFSVSIPDPKSVDWLGRVRAYEDRSRGEGLSVNLIVNSERGGMESAERFCTETLAMVDAYLAAGGNPTRWVVQTWYPNPKGMLPESDPNTLAGLTKAVIELVQAARPTTVAPLQATGGQDAR